MMGKQSILACLLLSIDYVTISIFKRKYILREQILEGVISKWQVIICTSEDCNLLSWPKLVHRSVAQVCSDERLGIDSNSHIFGSCFFCVRREMTVSSSFPQTSLLPLHIVNDTQRSVTFMLNLLTSYADSVIFTF